MRISIVLRCNKDWSCTVQFSYCWHFAIRRLIYCSEDRSIFTHQQYVCSQTVNRFFFCSTNCRIVALIWLRLLWQRNSVFEPEHQRKRENERSTYKYARSIICRRRVLTQTTHTHTNKMPLFKLTKLSLFTSIQMASFTIVKSKIKQKKKLI